MSVINKKKDVFGKIAALKTLTQGLPKIKLNSSFPSVNNSGDVILFLTDLIKSLIGYEALVSSIIDTITYSLPKIEKSVKKSLKVELKNIVSCGVDPSIPTWFKSTGVGINIEVKKIDFSDILRISPNSISGPLIYSDITNPTLNSNDFNTFLYGVIQNENTEQNWKNILTVKFIANGASLNIPNNSLIIKAHQSYNNKTLTDLNNDFVESITLFKSDNILNKIIDIIYGTISSTINKPLKQLQEEAKINSIIDKMVTNNNVNPIPDSAFSFTNDEVFNQEKEAVRRKKGVNKIKTSGDINSSIPISDLTSFTENFNSTTNISEQKNLVKFSLNKMADSSVKNITSPSDMVSSKLNFIQEIIMSLIKSVVSVLLSPKVILVFMLNYKIIYGPQATYENGSDFIKKNKKLITNIIKTISEELIKILLNIALKEIGNLVAQSIAKRQKEKVILKTTQLQTLIGVPPNIIQQLLKTLT
jgi:hypothetical protein